MKIKIIAGIASAFLGLFLLLAPVIIAANVINATVAFIADLFASSKDDVELNDSDQLIKAIDNYSSSIDGIDNLLNNYQPILSENKLGDKTNVFFILDIIASVEDFDKELLENNIKIYLEVDKDDYQFISRIKETEPYKTVFTGVSNQKILKYITYYKTKNYGDLPKVFLAQFKEDELIYPLIKLATISTGYGWDILHGESRWHPAIDLAIKCGTPVYSSSDGVVADTQGLNTHKVLGNYVIVKNKTDEFKYLHLENPVPYAINKKVNKGDFLGFVGNTGQSTGCHLHFAMRKDNHDYDFQELIDFKNPITYDGWKKE